MSASPVARIEQLEEIEKDVISILQTAGATLSEIAKDRPAQKTVDQHTQKVMSDIKSVEQNLSEQIKYLTQVSTGITIIIRTSLGRLGLCFVGSSHYDILKLFIVECFRSSA